MVLPDEPDDVIRLYSESAPEFAKKFNQYDRSVMFTGLDRVLTPDVRRVLDVGAGNGIDARRFAQEGRVVVAAEPSDLIDIARRDNNHPHITWVRDRLPALASLDSHVGTFDLVFSNRVLMHVRPEDQKDAFLRMMEFMAPSGAMYLVIRIGSSTDKRATYPVDVDVFAKAAQENGKRFETFGIFEDYDGRPEITWGYYAVFSV